MKDLRVAAQRARQDLRNEAPEVQRAAQKKYLPRMFMLATSVIPVGWPLAVLGFIPSEIISGKGDKQIKKLHEGGQLKGDGTLKRALNIHHIWEEMFEDAPSKIMDEINQGLDHLFPDSDGKMGAVKSNLRMKQGSTAFNTLNKGCNARRAYYQTSMGKVHKNTIRFLKGPARPLRVPLMVAGGLRQLLFFLKLR